MGAAGPAKCLQPLQVPRLRVYLSLQPARGELCGELGRRPHYHSWAEGPQKPATRYL